MNKKIDKQAVYDMADIIDTNTTFDTMREDCIASAEALYKAGYRKQSDTPTNTPTQKQFTNCELEMLDIIAKAREEYANDVTDRTENEYIREALLDAGYRRQEWISVDERLPEREGKYLTYTTKGTVVISNFYTYLLGEKPQFDYWITHWMSLPESPNMKGGKV